MEDYIVIILTLIIAVASAFNRKKKKNAPAPPPSDESNEPSSFWDMLMEEQGLDEEPVRSYVDDEPDYEEEAPEVERFKQPVVSPRYEFDANSEGQTDFKEAMKKVEKKKRQVLIDGEKFSLKKAVIYSEILNRKYT